MGKKRWDDRYASGQVVRVRDKVNYAKTRSGILVSNMFFVCAVVSALVGVLLVVEALMS